MFKPTIHSMMIFRQNPDDQYKTTVISYSILEPIKLKIEKPDGRVVLMGFGIGDVLKIVEPALQTLVARDEHWQRIPLEDGSFILDMPLAYNPKRIW